MIEIGLRNFSTKLSKVDFEKIVNACQRQISEDYRRVYGGDAKLEVFDVETAPPAGFWQANLFDDAPQAGYLGYHDVTASGQPLSNIYVGTTLRYGGIPSVTVSHELLEMMGDPWVNLSVVDSALKRAWNFELCDAVEADDLGYTINGVLVSDFVLPSYFERDIKLPGGHPRSFCNHVSSPFALAPGGYMGFFDFVTGDWDQIDAQRSLAHGGDGSRSQRRRKPHTERLRSSAK